MRTQAAGDLIVVALMPGEEILESLRDVADAHAISGGTLTGLGSTSEVEIAFFDPSKQEYQSRTFKEPMEIGCMVGNFSMLEDRPHVHVHVTVAGPELIAFCGHLSRGVVGTACEIYVRKLDATILRVKDADAGFHPLKLK